MAAATAVGLVLVLYHCDDDAWQQMLAKDRIVAEIVAVAVAAVEAAVFVIGAVPEVAFAIDFVFAANHSHSSASLGPPSAVVVALDAEVDGIMMLLAGVVADAVAAVESWQTP